MSMKNILRLMGALALTTGAATSVIACGQKAGVAMDAVVSKQLGLTDEKGEGLLSPSFDVSKPSEVTWTVTAAAAITADKLLVEGDKAANQSCYDFITKVLNEKPKEGDKFENGVFNKEVLKAITSEVSNVTPTLKPVDKKDYAVTGGTFSFQFKKGDTKLGDVYGINLKVDDKTGVFNAELEKVVSKIAVADTNVADNDNIMFKIGTKVPESAKKPGVAIAVNDKADAGKQFASLNKITGLKITAELGAVIHAGEEWAAGDKLEIVYKAGDVTFEAKTTLTLA